MAEEKDKLGNELLSQDFLNFDNIQGTGGGLQNQLAQLGAVQRQAPLYKAATMRSVYQPIVKMIENAEDQIAAGMVAYQLANPELDDSQMFDGTSSIVTDVMTENNVKFKELNRKLGYMTPRHPDYAATVAEIAKINETSINLRNDNKKLLAVRNTIKDLDVQEMSKGQTPGEKLMYNDILVGNTENFQNIDGKLHWVNPNIEDESDPTRAISIDSVNAAGPTMTDDAAFDQHYNLFSAVRKTKAEDLTDQDLNYQINGMFKAVGNDGLKSLIFDSENSELEGDQMVGYAKNGMMFNTSEWFESYYNELGINPQSEQAQQIRADVQRNGVMHSVNGIRVKDHFRDWYAEKLKNAEKTGDGKPEKKNALDFGVDTPETTDGTGSDTTPNPVDISDIAPPKVEGTNFYKGQTGKGSNYGISSSPFAGITQYGWAPESDPSGRDMGLDDHLFDYGSDKYVAGTLNREYGDYGFSFDTKSFAAGDQLVAQYNHPILGLKENVFEFDNASDKTDKEQAVALQEWMHEMIGWTPSK